jgi:hypothetical protein
MYDLVSIAGRFHRSFPARLSIYPFALTISEPDPTLRASFLRLCGRQSSVCNNTFHRNTARIASGARAIRKQRSGQLACRLGFG